MGTTYSLPVTPGLEDIRREADGSDKCSKTEELVAACVVGLEGWPVPAKNSLSTTWTFLFMYFGLEGIASQVIKYINPGFKSAFQLLTLYSFA